jgi:nickel/cobalt transporter (NicO) family protein
MMGAVFEWQRELYAGAIAALKTLHAGGDPTQLVTLVITAFGFGLLHALLPGHGKAVLTSHHAGTGDARSAVLSSIIVIAVHVGSAIVIVLAGFAVLQKTIGGAGRAPMLEKASQALIIVVGLWLLWQALRPRGHHAARSGPALALAAGLVPCPLTTFIMTYALVNGAVGAGLMLSGAFGLGMMVTVAVFPLLAVLLRSRVLPSILQNIVMQERLGRTLAVVAAAGVIGLGAWPLLRPWLR